MPTTAKSAAKKKKVAKTEVEGAEGAVATPKVKKAPVKRARKVVEPPRIKLYWGVFNQNLKRVAVFEYGQKKDAEKHCKDLSKAGAEHFLQKVRETIEVS
ncbi:MAG: hypothetical protein SGI77_20405 [Pirellulaceae bacterium]|nr:hypothetical protein [Pirellulaceae bacterium]